MINDSVLTTSHSLKQQIAESDAEFQNEIANIVDKDVPRKVIKSQTDMTKFKHSKAFLVYDNFLKELNESIKSKPLPSKTSDVVKNASPVLQLAMSFFDELEEYMKENPPVEIKDGQTSRFGNLAYRDWFDRMTQESDRMMDSLLDKALEWFSSSCTEQKSSPTTSSATSSPTCTESSSNQLYNTKEEWHRKELSAYWKDSFGNRTRIDYGTGHEATFCAWMCCLARLNMVTRKDSYFMAAVLFPRYIDTMRKIQLYYKLEPAGSHGVWGLDDHQFLTYVWGSAQLINNPEEIKPASIHDRGLVERYADKYMYLAGIQFIYKVKKGPFGEHSPLLNDISGVPKWMKINSGLIKMYYDEVLFKFVVIQHFLFGKLLPFEPAEDKYSSSAMFRRPSNYDVSPLTAAVSAGITSTSRPQQQHPNLIGLSATVPNDQQGTSAPWTTLNTPYIPTTVMPGRTPHRSDTTHPQVHEEKSK